MRVAMGDAPEDENRQSSTQHTRNRKGRTFPDIGGPGYRFDAAAML
jgi:hypothetical protein